MKKNILFVISNDNIGGPQKSLLALLERLDYTLFNIDVMILNPSGNLKELFPKEVNVLKADKLLTAFTMPSDSIFYTLGVFLKELKIRQFFLALKAMFNYKIKKRPMNQERQKFWVENSKHLEQSDKNYDFAFGILGLSTYYVVDCVNAEKKYHWIRSDSRMLNRDLGIENYYFKKIDGALSVSQECESIFNDMYPYMNGRTKVFYNYLPLSFYDSFSDNTVLSKDSINLITVARLDPLKGLDLAIKACKLLVDKGYEIKWYVLGDGKGRKEIEKMIEEYSLQEVMILFGFKLNTLQYIKQTDIFVHPSRAEGKSNAVDEAKYAGVPIVVTNYPTVKEQIDNEYNGLIAQFDEVDLSNKIERLIKDKELAKTLGQNSINEQNEVVDPNSFLCSL